MDAASQFCCTTVRESFGVGRLSSNTVLTQNSSLECICAVKVGGGGLIVTMRTIVFPKMDLSCRVMIHFLVPYTWNESRKCLPCLCRRDTDVGPLLWGASQHADCCCPWKTKNELFHKVARLKVEENHSQIPPQIRPSLEIDSRQVQLKYHTRSRPNGVR